MDKRSKADFLIEENSSNAKLGSISFSAVVQWVSCSRMTGASCCKMMKNVDLTCSEAFDVQL